MALAAMFAFNTVADAQIAEMVTYDGKDFTVQHPKEYADVIDDWTPGVVNEWKKDDKHKLSVWPRKRTNSPERTKAGR